MPAPISTPLPSAPQRNEPEAQFIQKSNAFVGALEPFRQQLQSQADFINLVFNDVPAIEAVQAISAEVQTVAGISANVTAVAGNAANVNAAVANAGNITAVADNEANINSVVANEADIDEVALNMSSVKGAITSAQVAMGAKADAESARNQSQDARDAALAVVNFAGKWGDLTGALSAGASVLHLGAYWRLLADLADVTTSEPGYQNLDWALVYSNAERRHALLAEATLNLDFANNQFEVYDGPVNGLTAKPFNQLVTFTRASAASARNAIGGLSPVLTDQQRLVGNREGLLIEEQRTNLPLWSEGFDSAAWGKLRVSVNANIAEAPDGTMTADAVVPDLQSAIHLVSQAVTTQTNKTYTTSLFVKANGYSNFRLGGSSDFARVDLASKAVSKVGSIVSAGIEPAKNGWYRVYLTRLINTTSHSFDLRIEPNGDVNAPGDGTSGIYIWGAQMEEGAFPTSYIKTEGTQVTRSADIVSVNGLGGWFNTDEGTLYLEIESRLPAADRQNIIGSGGTSNDWGVQYAGDNDRFEVWKGDIGALNRLFFTYLAGTEYALIKLAISSDAFGCVLSVNGASVSDTVPLNWAYVKDVFDEIPLGKAVQSRAKNIKYKTVKYIPEALTATEIEALTAPEVN